MPYNPALPADHALIVAAELRSQFAALKALIDDLPNSAAMTAAIIRQSSGNSDTAQFPAVNVSDPPTRDEVQAICDYLGGLMVQLKRSA